MTTLTSSAPGILEALYNLVKTAGEAQNPKVTVFDYEVGQFEPATFATVHAIDRHEWDWESIGYQQRERYDVVGCVSVYTGDSPFTSPAVGLRVMNETYTLFNACVMAQVISNRTAPFLSTTGPTPQIMLPAVSGYRAAPATVDGGPGGWVGVIDWSFHFEAIITPA